MVAGADICEGPALIRSGPLSLSAAFNVREMISGDDDDE